jgi:hypothetical protein
MGVAKETIEEEQTKKSEGRTSEAEGPGDAVEEGLASLLALSAASTSTTNFLSAETIELGKRQGKFYRKEREREKDKMESEMDERGGKKN